MKIVAVDTETDSINPYEAKLKVISWKDYKEEKGHAVRFPTGNATILDILLDRSILKIFHNQKYDRRVLHNAGVRLRGRTACTMVMSQMLIRSKKHGLKFLTKTLLREDYEEQDRLKKWMKKHKKTMPEAIVQAPDGLIAHYAIKDAVSTMNLFLFLSILMKRYEMWPLFWKEMSLTNSCIIPMESRGMQLDVKECEAQRQECQAKAALALKGMRALVRNQDFNPRSTRQLGLYIFPDWDIKEHVKEHARIERETGRALQFSPIIKETPTGLASTDEYCLRRSKTRLADMVIEYRKAAIADKKYLGGFLNKRDSNDIIHTTFNQNGAITGRFSSDSPNLQNIPKGGSSLLACVRRCLRARPGYVLVFLDYDQIEIKLAAHFSEQPYMLEILNRGGDLHEYTAKRYYGVDKSDSEYDKFRNAAKTQNYAMLYGCGARRLQEVFLQRVGLNLDYQTCRDYVSQYWITNDRIAALKDKLQEEIYDTGGIRNPFGRFMSIHIYDDYKAVNWLIQSTAGDVIKEKMPICKKILKGTDSHMILQVHDELGYEMRREDLPLVSQLKQAMEELTRFRVPLTCSASYGLNWKDKKDIPNKRLQRIGR